MEILSVFDVICSVTVPGYQGNLQAAISHSAALAAWERFGVEFILTFVVVLCYFVSTDAIKKFMGNSAFAIGAAYSACCFVSVSLTLIMMLKGMPQHRSRDSKLETETETETETQSEPQETHLPFAHFYGAKIAA